MKNRERITELAPKAAKGDKAAFNELYLLTRDRAYFVAFSIAREEQDALDIVQDAYLKAWQHIRELGPPWEFGAWLQKITGNTAKNFIRQRQPQLFKPNDEEVDILELQPENDGSYIPDAAMDTAETRRLILEIVDDLPEDQRLCVLMYYYDEMPLQEIAAALEIPYGTVMSRLHLARKKISDGVEKLEKKGTKLYGAPPMSLVSWLLKHAAIEGSTKLPPLILGGAAAAGGTAAAGIAAVALPKIIAGAAAAAVVGGGTFAGVSANRAAEPPVLPTTVATAAAVATNSVTTTDTMTIRDSTGNTMTVIFGSSEASRYSYTQRAQTAASSGGEATKAAFTTAKAHSAAQVAGTAYEETSAAETTKATTAATTEKYSYTQANTTTSDTTTVKTTAAVTATSASKTTAATTTTQVKRTMTITFLDSNNQRRTSQTVTVQGTGSGTVTAPAPAAVDGWNARGWTTSTNREANATYAQGEAIPVNGDITYYAVYEKTLLTLTFDPKGGAPAPSSIPVISKFNSADGQASTPAVTMPPAPARDGYLFAAWQDGSGERYLPGDHVIPDSPNLKAVWTIDIPLT